MLSTPVPYCDIETAAPMGQEDQPAKVTILCQHGCKGERFREANPQLDENFAHPELREPFLKLEQDFASCPLARAVFEKLSQVYSTKYIKHRVLRGYIDTNRTAERAVRNVFKPGSQSEMEALLLPIHAKIIQATREAIEGYLIQIHTMAPHCVAISSSSPSQTSKETPDTIPEYMALYRDRKNWLAPRPICFSASILDADGQSIERIDHAPLTDAIKADLEEAGYKSDHDNPYGFDENVEGGLLLQQHPGTFIDVPKHLLAQGDLSTYDPCDLRLDLQKIDKLATIIARAIIKFLAED